tara:strand:- start:10771 stop:11247 length:477 start_codon:yes stop_codon:yes gene_type:complete
MAVNVNPPPQLDIPRDFIGDISKRNYFEQIETILFQLWQRTGGTTDEIDNSKQNISSSSSRVSRNAARINSLELKEFEIVSTVTDLLAEEFQIIICKNVAAISVTLDPQAIENDEVHIKRRGGTVNVIGSIDGFTDKVINVLNYSMHLVFDGTDWSEI